MNYFTNNVKKAPLIHTRFKSFDYKSLIVQIMRVGFIALFLLSLAVNLLHALPVKSQDISEVRVKLELKDKPLITALHEIERQTPFRFVFHEKTLLAAPSRNLRASIYTVDQALSLLLWDTKFSYKQLGNNVLIMLNTREPATESEALLDIPVRGRVTDVTGAALEGISVAIRGGSVGATTDAEGLFSLTVPDSTTALVFSSIGFTTQVVPINGRTEINVTLNADLQAIDEVVVTALGITREAKSLTYSSQTLAGEKLSETKEVSMINSLQGKVPGLTITRSSNGPGSNATVLLRGNRSITGNNAPLYVTDGVPGAIGLEDGDNIESITVLKGASAAALYGSAGQNGAIIITTKKGAAGKLAIDFNGGFALDQATIFQELQYDYGQGDAGTYVPDSEHSYGLRNTGETVTLWNGNSVPLTGQPDRFEDFFRLGTTLNNSLSITSGSEKQQTYFSYGNIRSNGIMRNNYLMKHMFNFRINNTISPRLSFDTKFTYINENIHNVPNRFAITSMFRSPTSIPLSEMEKFNYIDSEGRERQNYWKPGSSIIGNPFYYMYRNLEQRREHQLLGLFSATYKVADWVNLLVRGSISKTFDKSEEEIYGDSYHSLVGSNYLQTNGNNFNAIADALLTFDKRLSDNFTLTGNLGGSIQVSKFENISADANGLYKENFFFMNNAKAPQVVTDHGQSPEVQALYASAALGYRAYLYLEVTGRNDWSSALPQGQYAIFYPSVGLTAIVSDMINLPSWINLGKVRLSTANSGYGGNAYLGQEYYSVDQGGLIVTPTIQSFGAYKPELTNSIEAGLDWRFFGNRLNIDFTYYRTHTKNQLLLIGAPSASTYDQRYINAGLIRNSGVEFLIGATPVTTGRFSWDVMLNYSKNVNKVIRITPEMPSVIIQDDDIVTTKVETGSSFGNLYVKGWQRDDQGRKLVDDMGRPMLTPGKTILAGNFNPNYTMSLSNTLRYANLSLGFQIDYRNGGVIIGGTQALLDADGHSARSLEGRENGIILDAYTPEGEKNDQTITSQAYFSAIGDRKPTGEEYAYSATNIRMREITLGYTLPQQLFSEGLIKNIRFSLVGRNLFFLKRSAPFDPDIARGRGGTEYTALPFTRTFGLNAKVSF